MMGQHTRVVRMASFLAFLVCPQQMLYIRSTKWNVDLGVGIMLNGGGTVEPSLK